MADTPAPSPVVFFDFVQRWTQAFAEVRQWLQGSYSGMESAGSVIAVKRNKKDAGKDTEGQLPTKRSEAWNVWRRIERFLPA